MGPARPVSSTTGTVVRKPDQATNLTLLAANSRRKGFIIFNNSPSPLAVKFGETCSSSSYSVRLNTGDSYSSEPGCLYTGIIDGYWDTDAGGAAFVTEFT